MTDFEYPNLRRITYGEGEYEGMTFVPVCPKCGKYVKADKNVNVDFEGQPKGENGNCKKCGRIEMLFEGYY